MAKPTITELANKITTEADAYAYFEGLRWPNGPVCPHCGNREKHYFLTPKSDTGRKTRTGAVTERRVWKCAQCRKQFSVITGTVFHGSKVSLRTWLFVVFEMAANKNGFAAREIERKYGVAPKTAWFMAHRIREAMANRAPGSLLVGTIVADETWIGGDPKNHHWKPIEPELLKPGHSRVRTDKTPVVSLVSVETGEVRSRVVADVTGRTLRKVIEQQVDIANSHLQTDAASAYLPVGREFLSHQSVAHERGEYVRDGVTTNRLEGYFAQMKRSIDGTHHHVSKVHLHRYVSEFDFRYSTCKDTDAVRMARLMGQTGGRRLRYRDV